MKVLLLNQAFYPDVVSSAQHAVDLARSLAERGHEVTVISSRRAYDDPARLFAAEESWNGIRIIRIPATGLGKRRKWRRAVDFATFLVSCVVRMLRLGRFDLIIAMTSPPLLSVVGSLYAQATGSRVVLWIMDLNPDEAIAAGWLRAKSPTATALEALLRYSLRRAAQVVVLDRFMQKRIVQKGIRETRISVIPPWSHDEAIKYSREGRDRFRSAHGLTGKFVIMYSGNHSPCHPLDTLLEVAHGLVDRPEIAFCFVGGGSEFHKVKAFSERHQLCNIICLPYQPIEKLHESLSAADMHAVVMGDPFVGIIHPCKIYNVLALGTPFLYVGPRDSHINDLIQAGSLQQASYSARHGAVRAITTALLWAARDPKAEVPALHQAAKRFSQRVGVSEMLQVIEAAGVPGTRLTPEASANVSASR